MSATAYAVDGGPSSRGRRALAVLAGLGGLGLVAGCTPERFLIADSGVDRDVRAIYASRSEGFWLVGAQGLIVRFDGASTFTDTSSDADPGPRVANYYDVTEQAGATYLVGDDGVILRGDGRDFAAEDNRDGTRLRVVQRAGPTVLFAAGDDGTLRRRAGAEMPWQGVDVGAGGARFTGAWAISEASLVLCTDRGTIIERDADDWVSQTVVTETSTTPRPLFDVWSSTTGADLVAVGLGGSIFRRPAGEPAWRSEASPVTQDLYSLYGHRPDDIFAVGAEGTIVHFDGASWSVVPSGTGRDLFAIDGTSDGTIIVAGGARGTVVVLRR